MAAPDPNWDQSEVKADIRLPTKEAQDGSAICSHHHNEPKTTETKPETKVKVKRKKILHCITCSFTAKTKKSYLRHVQSRGHIAKTKQKDAKCNVCNAKAMSDLKKCPMCNYTSDNIKSLKLHINIHNKQGLPFKCGKCQFAAQNVQSLIDHHKTVTKYCTKGTCKYSAHSAEELRMHKKVCAWR